MNNLFARKFSFIGRYALASFYTMRKGRSGRLWCLLWLLLVSPYIYSQGCPTSVPIFKCSNLDWDVCSDDDGYGGYFASGSCTNLKDGGTCKISMVEDRSLSTQKRDQSGGLNCPGCHPEWHTGDYDYQYDYTEDFLILETDQDSSCIEFANDHTCSIPHFSHDNLVWDWCTKGDGQGRLTNTESGIPVKCTVRTSSVCESGANSCGVINCGNYECMAGWNIASHPVYYNLPSDCYGTSSVDKRVIIPVSVVSAIAGVAAITAIAIVATCFGYHRYKRQGYQTVHGTQ